MNNLYYQEESYKIIGACITVFNKLGSGFLERVYHEALNIELIEQNIPFIKEARIEIKYNDKILNTKYRADFICFNKIIVEIKALDKLLPVHEAQVINYLKATEYKLGLLINFGEESLKFKRLIRHNKSIKLDDKLPPFR